MPDSSAPPIDPAVAIIVGSVRRALGQRAAIPDPNAISAFAPQIATLARFHRLSGCLAEDPDIATHLTQTPIGRARDRTITLLVELSRVIQRLALAGVPAIPLKGPLLSARLLGRATFREAHDLDILTRWETIDQAQAALAPEYQPDSDIRRTRAGREQHEVMRPVAGGRSVELHWTLLHPMTGVALPENEPWRSARPRDTAGISHLALDPAVEIAVVCTHAAHHFGFRLHWMCDVAALLLRSERDVWKQALEIGAEWRVRRAMLTSVKAASLLFALPLENGLTEPVRRYASDRVARWMATRVLTGTIRQPNQFSIWHRRPLLFDNLAQMMGATANMAFSPLPEDRAAAGLPSWADPLTSLLRPIFVVQRAVKRWRVTPSRTSPPPGIDGDRPVQ